jgi:hypothetical protein
LALKIVVMARQEAIGNGQWARGNGQEAIGFDGFYFLHLAKLNIRYL